MEVSEIQEIHVIPISDSSFQVKINPFGPANDKTDREMICVRTDRIETILETEGSMRVFLLLILKNHSIWLSKKKGKILNFWRKSKVECVLPIVICSEIRMAE